MGLLRTGTGGGGTCDCGYNPSGCIKCNSLTSWQEEFCSMELDICNTKHSELIKNFLATSLRMANVTLDRCYRVCWDMSRAVFLDG